MWIAGTTATDSRPGVELPEELKEDHLYALFPQRKYMFSGRTKDWFYKWGLNNLKVTLENHECFIASVSKILILFAEYVTVS